MQNSNSTKKNLISRYGAKTAANKNVTDNIGANIDNKYNKNNNEDTFLIQQFVDGDQNAVNILLTKHHRKLYNYIITLDSSRADDLLQETLIKIIATIKAGKYQDKGKFIAWAMRLAHNIVIDSYRSNKNKRTITNDDAGYDILSQNAPENPSVEDDIITSQIHEQVRLLVELLPSEQKEVVLMRHFMNLSFKEISEQTGVSINTALGRMRYALINLRKLIDEKKLALI